MEELEGHLIPCLPLELALDCLLRMPLQSHQKLKHICRLWKSLVESPDFYSARRRCGYAEKYACLVQAIQNAPRLSNGEHVKAPLYGITLYNAKQGAWERLPPIDGLPHGLPLFCQCAAVGTSLVLMGGWDPITWAVLKCVYIYSFLAGTWRRGKDMKTLRSFFACASLQEQQMILVVGGHDALKNALNTAEAYDLKWDEWVEVGKMGEERDECKAVGIAPNKVLVLSGYRTETQGQFTRSVESFDLGSGMWKQEEKLEVPGSAPSCVVAHEGRVYAIAGGTLLVMGGAKNGWEELGGVPTQVSNASCAATIEGGILVLGSSSASLPNKAFICRLSGGHPTWQRLIVPDHFARHVQVACTIEA